MSNKRLFIAIDLPEEHRNQLADRYFHQSGIKWSKPEQIHLTLQFLGNCPLELFTDIGNNLKTIEWNSFELELQDTGFFPNQRRPNVFWVGIENSPPLQELKENIDQALKQCGIEPEARKFHPHLTLARIKRRLKPQVLEKIIETFDEIILPKFTVDSLVLYSSILDSTGATHIPEMKYFPEA